MEIVDRIKEFIAYYLSENDIELVDITYRREQPGMVLRLLVDTAEGVTMKECEGLNNFLNGLLDREDVIQERYTIEVASPGLDRPIISDRDFDRVMGKPIRITTYEPINGNKTHEGKLLGRTQELIVIEKDGVSVMIPRNKIANAKLKLEF